MLTGLHVKNFALIDEADIDLSPNLNILTGETGAGKSILLGAVNLALGARTPRDVIRTGADHTLAELTFTGVGQRTLDKCDELGISVDDDTLVISRKLMANGKSIVRVNGEMLSAGAVREITSELIDIYGQNEHQSLSDKRKQLEIVDRFAGDEAARLRAQVSAAHAEYTALRDEYEELDNDPASRERTIDLMSFEINEIEQAELREGEEEELKDEHKLLANTHIIAEQLGGALTALDDEQGCSTLISGALKNLSRISEFDDRLSGFYDTLSDADALISDLSHDIESYLDDMPDSEERLREVEERLDLISHLKNKYGQSVEAINAYLERDKAELDKLTKFDVYIAGLKQKLDAAERTMNEAADRLSACRHRAASILEQRIQEALGDLNFNRTLFKIALSDKDACSADGRDDAEYMISLNPGEEPKPLTRVASGGELSRIMLAIKSVMAVRDDIDTLIFDEIDTGISGRTAQKVAEKLAAISGVHQVICITHLPQLASMADTHLFIEKTADDSSTHVNISVITGAEITAELARLLSGAEVTDAMLGSAAEVKKLADERKAEVRSAVKALD